MRSSCLLVLSRGPRCFADLSRPVNNLDEIPLFLQARLYYPGEFSFNFMLVKEGNMIGELRLPGHSCEGESTHPPGLREYPNVQLDPAVSLKMSAALIPFQAAGPQNLFIQRLVPVNREAFNFFFHGEQKQVTDILHSC